MPHLFEFTSYHRHSYKAFIQIHLYITFAETLGFSLLLCRETSYVCRDLNPGTVLRPAHYQLSYTSIILSYAAPRLSYDEYSV